MFDDSKRTLQLSCDGVSECLSTSVTLDVYSVKFEGCKNVYPLRIIRPLKKFNIDQMHQLKQVLTDLRKNNCKISQFIADNPKRSNARNCLCFSSWYPCEYCFSKGVKIVTTSIESKKKKESIKMQKEIVSEKIESVLQHGSRNSSQILKLKNIEKKLIAEEKSIKPTKSNIVWPKSTMDGPPRTTQEINDITDRIENGEDMTIDDRKGIIGRSLFSDIPGFNLVSDMPVDYLHCGCLGVIKRCVELTFRVGENRPRVTNRKLSLPSQFNEQIGCVKGVREYNRRIRELDFSVYKGQEFRNLALFYFPLILNCIEPNHKERHMWLYLSFMLKACVLSIEEFRPFPLPLLDRCTKAFYGLYEQLFGPKNCTYNTHVFSSHLIEMRYHGPLTSTSAFPFESFYGEMRNSFVPGTQSPLKQIMQNILIKRAINDHKCQNDIYISPKESPKEANNMIYCFERSEFFIYKVQSIEGNSLICLPQGKSNCSFQEIPNLPWNLIGVFQKGKISIEPVVIRRENVKGKVIEVENLLITCPNDVLREK